MDGTDKGLRCLTKALIVMSAPTARKVSLSALETSPHLNASEGKKIFKVQSIPLPYTAAISCSKDVGIGWNSPLIGLQHASWKGEESS